MGKLTKNQKLAAEKIEAGKAYSLKEAASLVKEITFSKFDASLDIDVRLGVDPRKANQMVRGVVSLPHGTGKEVRVLVLCTPDAEAAAKEAGADYVGLDEYIEKIKGGWTDIDVIITMPSIMGKIGALGRVLGPRGFDKTCDQICESCNLRRLCSHSGSCHENSADDTQDHTSDAGSPDQHSQNSSHNLCSKHFIKCRLPHSQSRKYTVISHPFSEI